MRSGASKAFLDLGGRPLFVRSIEAFAGVPRVDQIVVVVRRDDVAAARAAVAPIVPDADVVVGGATRRESSLAGIRAATAETVLIHDGCRPFVHQALIDRVIDAAECHDGVVPVLPSTETLYLLQDGGDRVLRALDRASIVRAQTPQGFRRSLILRCLKAADPTVTDDASALIMQGEPVLIVEGDPANLKVTVPEDLRWAEAFIDRTDRHL